MVEAFTAAGRFPPIGAVTFLSGSPESGHLLGQLPVGDTTLYLELIAVAADRDGRVTAACDPAHQYRIDALLAANDNPDPQPLHWAGRTWLVLGDPAAR